MRLSELVPNYLLLLLYTFIIGSTAILSPHLIFSGPAASESLLSEVYLFRLYISSQEIREHPKSVSSPRCNPEMLASSSSSPPSNCSEITIGIAHSRAVYQSFKENFTASRILAALKALKLKLFLTPIQRILLACRAIS